jgi:pimeloyl-ACP methyl ester carboxylesterase
MPSWTDRFWYSAEGLRLHYRDYEGRRDTPPILCIPGLTRNARDFEPVAEQICRRLARHLRRTSRAGDERE